MASKSNRNTNKAEVKASIIAQTDRSYKTFTETLEFERDRLRGMLQKTETQLLGIRQKVDGVIRDTRDTMNSL